MRFSDKVTKKVAKSESKPTAKATAIKSVKPKTTVKPNLTNKTKSAKLSKEAEAFAKTNVKRAPDVAKPILTEHISSVDSSKLQLVLSPAAETLPESIREKVLRRARRHFSGQNVNHRVSQKDANSITFAFNRRNQKYPGLGYNTKITVTKTVEPTKTTTVKNIATKAIKKPVAKKSTKSVVTKQNKQ